ncbi:hypothetical protein C8R45DRAFT_931075 [Mycena sanguinolenta]|nr:hypothetical protein C8R45DRAFT_931075 [Mycena sanguinolenta]
MVHSLSIPISRLFERDFRPNGHIAAPHLLSGWPWNLRAVRGTFRRTERATIASPTTNAVLSRRVRFSSVSIELHVASARDYGSAAFNFELQARSSGDELRTSAHPFSKQYSCPRVVWIYGLCSGRHTDAAPRWCRDDVGWTRAGHSSLKDCGRRRSIAGLSGRGADDFCRSTAVDVHVVYIHQDFSTFVSTTNPRHVATAPIIKHPGTATATTQARRGVPARDGGSLIGERETRASPSTASTRDTTRIAGGRGDSTAAAVWAPGRSIAARSQRRPVDAFPMQSCLGVVEAVPVSRTRRPPSPPSLPPTSASSTSNFAASTFPPLLKSVRLLPFPREALWIRAMPLPRRELSAPSWISRWERDLNMRVIAQRTRVTSAGCLRRTPLGTSGRGWRWGRGHKSGYEGKRKRGYRREAYECEGNWRLLPLAAPTKASEERGARGRRPTRGQPLPSSTAKDNPTNLRRQPSGTSISIIISTTTVFGGTRRTTGRCHREGAGGEVADVLVVVDGVGAGRVYLRRTRRRMSRTHISSEDEVKPGRVHPSPSAVAHSLDDSLPSTLLVFPHSYPFLHITPIPSSLVVPVKTICAASTQSHPTASSTLALPAVVSGSVSPTHRAGYAKTWSADARETLRRFTLVDSRLFASPTSTPSRCTRIDSLRSKEEGASVEIRKDAVGVDGRRVHGSGFARDVREHKYGYEYD